jgi:hypothetical protein
MALRCISQVATAATTETDLVDGSNVEPLQLKSLIVCNRAASAATFRMRLAKANEAVATKQYIYYDLPIVPSDSFTLALDIGIEPGDKLVVYASNANLSFNLFAV